MADAGEPAERRVAPVGGYDELRRYRLAVREPDDGRVEAGQKSIDGRPVAEANVRHVGEPREQRAARCAVRHVPAEQAVTGLGAGEIGGCARPSHPAARIDDAHGAEPSARRLHRRPGSGARQCRDGRLQEGGGAQVMPRAGAGGGAGGGGIDHRDAPTLGAEARRGGEPGDAATGDEDVRAIHRAGR